MSILVLLAVLYGCEKNQPPVCEIISPENGSEIITGDRVTFSVDAHDPDGFIQKVRLYIDGILLESVFDLPYNFSWETDEVELGNYVIRAVAVDDENDESEASIEIKIIESPFDEEEPVVEIIFPPGDSIVDGTINIVAKAMDNVGVEYIDFLIKEEGWVVFDKDSTPAFFEYSTSLNTNNYPDGLTHLLIAAYDAAGNCGKDSVNIYINNSGDTVAPVVELFEPINNDTISDYIVFRAKANDNIGIEHVDFNILDGIWRLLGTDYYAIGDKEYAILWDTRNTPDGKYGIEAVAYDDLGNRGYDRIGITIDNSGSRPDDDSFIYEGRKYYFKTIGTQTWMVENLAYLPSITYSGSGADELNAPLYKVYEYYGTSTEAARHTVNYFKYGVLYNWKAAITACPEGWHLPSDEEWKTLEKYLWMDQSDVDRNGWRDSGWVGYHLKSSSGWKNDGNGDNSSEFNALPGGYRDTDGLYKNLGFRAEFWSSSGSHPGNCIARSLQYDKLGIYRGTYSSKYYASVRCIKDD